MKDVRQTISRNLARLRREKGVTQAELAEQFNYSDKAISRWEHGDTLPDVNVLCELCEFYGVTLNDLVAEECTLPTEGTVKRKRDSFLYRLWICIMWAAVIWLLATIVFAYTLSVRDAGLWVVFVFAVPLSTAAVALAGRSMIRGIARFILASVVMWTTLASVYLYFLQYNFWMIFLVGVPLQLILFLRHQLKQFRYRQHR